MIRTRTEYAESELWDVRWIRQNEINDVFECINKETGETDYLSYPRSMDMSADEILEDLDTD